MVRPFMFRSISAEKALANCVTTLKVYFSSAKQERASSKNYFFLSQMSPFVFPLADTYIFLRCFPVIPDCKTV